MSRTATSTKIAIERDGRIERNVTKEDGTQHYSKKHIFQSITNSLWSLCQSKRFCVAIWIFKNYSKNMIHETFGFHCTGKQRWQRMGVLTTNTVFNWSNSKMLNIFLFFLRLLRVSLSYKLKHYAHYVDFALWPLSMLHFHKRERHNNAMCVHRVFLSHWSCMLSVRVYKWKTKCDRKVFYQMMGIFVVEKNYLVAGLRVSFSCCNQCIVQIENYRWKIIIASIKCFINNITFIHYFTSHAHKHTHHRETNFVGFCILVFSSSFLSFFVRFNYFFLKRSKTIQFCFGGKLKKVIFFGRKEWINERNQCGQYSIE